jgi:hypothetical protein
VRGNFPLVQKRVVRCTHVAQVDFLFLVVGTCLENQFSGLTSHEAPLHFWPSRYLRNAFPDPEVTEPNADYVNNFQLVAMHAPQVSRSIFDNLCRRHKKSVVLVNTEKSVRVIQRAITATFW